jgi:hypothetical protein
MPQASPLEATKQAIDEQVIPQLFSAEQIAEMKKPYHDKADYYFLVNDEDFLKVMGATLIINDARIMPEQIAAAAKSINVTVDGKTQEIALHVYKPHNESVQAWQDGLAYSYVSREAKEKLEAGLAEKFNLAKGKDFKIEYGSMNNINFELPTNDPGFKTRTAALYLVKIWNKEALKQTPAIEKYIHDQLKAITPGRPSDVYINSAPNYFNAPRQAR